MVLFRKKTLRNTLKTKKNIFAPPFIRIDFSTTFSRINDPKIYRYKTVQEIGVDINLLKTKNMSTVEETIEEVK
jgi:hypothetical protein